MNSRHARPLLKPMDVKAYIIGASLATICSMSVALYLLLKQLRTPVKPIWAKVQRTISEDLRLPSLPAKYKRMGDLIYRLEDLSITDKERTEVKALLVEFSTDMNPKISKAQRESADIMSIIMGKVLLEAGSSSPFADVEPVGVKVDE